MATHYTVNTHVAAGSDFYILLHNFSWFIVRNDSSYFSVKSHQAMTEVVFGPKKKKANKLAFVLPLVPEEYLFVSICHRASPPSCLA